MWTARALQEIFNDGLHRLGAFIVVVINPKVQIILQLLDGLIDSPTERHLIELLQNVVM